MSVFNVERAEGNEKSASEYCKTQGKQEKFVDQGSYQCCGPQDGALTSNAFQMCAALIIRNTETGWCALVHFVPVQYQKVTKLREVVGPLMDKEQIGTESDKLDVIVIGKDKPQDDDKIVAVFGHFHDFKDYRGDPSKSWVEDKARNSIYVDPSTNPVTVKAFGK